ncbi:aminotransferase class I/II-fold pyridoxal phosphate-dependent enzyme [Edaphobacillus lindanitolerans]|uniref:Arginine/lysine/ornithine decarboxylase n=1 Tax=Edaphobacillus lindanitolerans TaxID=550447 RepID=A0A1U7PTS3_9BACI|nr:aminotransferase class I/II-fold pyridoxal phosphate-dependent enzyme [Edaphobacillus lindanitolerans]SIT93427.1 Arginine/lysine/ornithine decarboxylase [Edaphobacillus lindanitolerans]
MSDSQQRRPVVGMLEAFAKRGPISFHVPGHKNGDITGLPAGIRSILSWDVTELPGLDDLHAPEEAILEAQQLLADWSGAARSFFLVNGSTTGNLAMILSVCRPGDRILVQRNAHKSVFNGLSLAGAKPVYLSPEWDECSLAAGHVPAEIVREAVSLYPEAKGVILTNPTYYGVVSTELPEISAICRQAGIPLLVDEAHGAHFGAGDAFPVSSLRQGADIVVQSAHKTLPAMTMGSYLHIAEGSRVSHETVARQLGILQSSSPSYPLMASLDDARHFIATYQPADQESFLARRAQFIRALASIRSLNVVETGDPLKLLVRSEGLTGTALQEAFVEKGVHPELADPYQVLLMLPLLKKGHEDNLDEAVRRIREAMGTMGESAKPAPPAPSGHAPDIMEAELPPAEDPGIPAEWIQWTEAEGRISASSLIPYPPGIPLVLPGERITGETVSRIGILLGAGVPFQGRHRLKEGLIPVLLQSSEAYII